MPASPRTLMATAADFVDPNATPSQFSSAMRAQWQNPHDTLTLLMLVGGDVVKVALAQLAATVPPRIGPVVFPLRIAPVAFSFGWLSYSISALLSALGDGRLLPPPEYTMKLINIATNYDRDNQSWILSRLMRDEEHRLSGHVRRKGLTVAFYRPASDRGREMGEPARDTVYWVGVAVIVLQLVISIIPWFLHGDWIVFLVTVAGTLLALSATALPQWKREKYPARTIKGGKEKVYCLTRGNGAPVVMVFVLDRGLRLEDLAGARHEHSLETRTVTFILFVGWILLLLTVEGLDGDAWYLIGIGGLGMIQNIHAAGARRSCDALGFPLECWAEVHEDRVMDVLKRAEKEQRGVGLALVPTFFPGELRPDEKGYWDDRRREFNAQKDEKAAAASGYSSPVLASTTPISSRAATGSDPDVSRPTKTASEPV